MEVDTDMIPLGESSLSAKSIFHSRPTIEEGDLVIVYMARDNMNAIVVTPGEEFHNKYGRYAHTDFIGQKFGSKLHSPPPHSGYLHLLRPTPELWTLSLPHRTQILYLPDISYITMRLGVRVGGKVMEAGTGSGSMTHSLSRTVGPAGTVMSFEYHQPRYEKALEEFESHGLSNVTLQHRNVCKDGFGDASGVEGIFLDLPAPWEAIPHAMKTLRPDIITRICCFSPCLEQVLKTVSTLRSEGFFDIFTQEVLIRTHELVPPPNADPSHLGTVTSIVDRLQHHEKRKEERRAIQMRTAREKSRQATKEGEASATVDGGASSATAHGHATGEVGTKRKHDQTGPSSSRSQSQVGTIPATETTEPEVTVGTAPRWIEPQTQLNSAVITKPSAEMKGHTSYLTFACYYPESIRASLAAQEEEYAERTASESRAATPVGSRVAQLAAESREAGTRREGSQETEYGDASLDEVFGTLTEEDMIALAQF
ncbi:tRNA (adenine-N(1)-)-methyltransferase catalytic subunit TRM61 [Kwoniella heveanensis CBS 569]|nr:tRNA (adenine-N(1)-)-methyltransferase catalytic subunit TRM61 [Kwoniella heveanensis CBS 569]